MQPLRSITFRTEHRYTIEWYTAPINDDPSCDTNFNCIIAHKSEGGLGAEVNQINMPVAEFKWFTELMRNKSVFLLPQIVDLLIRHHYSWAQMKQELIKL